MNPYMVGGIFGALAVLGATFVVDLWWPGFIERRRTHTAAALSPEALGALTTELARIARALRADGSPHAVAVDHAALQALNLERQARVRARTTGTTTEPAALVLFVGGDRP